MYSDYDSPNSIILSIINSLSVFACLIVTLDLIFRVGYKSTTSQLVAFLNISILLCVISKVPFYFNSCHITESVFWCTYFQVQLMSYFLLEFSSSFIKSDVVFDALETFTIDSKRKFCVIIIPLTALVLAATSKSYLNYDLLWCGLDRKSEDAVRIYFIFFIFTMIIQVASWYQIFQILYFMKDASSDLQSVIFKKVLFGSGSYGIVTTLVGVFATIIGTVVLSSSLSHKADYFCVYAMLMIFNFLGFAYMGIYLHIRPQLVVGD